jgi:maltose O-acetyltransferase
MNATDFFDGKRRTEVLKEMLGECGDSVKIQQPFRCLCGVHLRVGSDVMTNYNCNILDGNIVTIGSRVLIAPDVKTYAGSHSLDVRERLKRYDDGILHVVSQTIPTSIGDDI